MKCYAIYHSSDCTCSSCESDNEFNDYLYFNDDDIIEAIQRNPKPSQFSDKGRHTIYTLECEKSEDGSRLIFKRDNCNIELNISEFNPEDDSRLYINQYKLIEFLCADSAYYQTFTIDADDKAGLTRMKKEWSKYE